MSRFMTSMIKGISERKIPINVCELNKQLKDSKLLPKESASPSEVIFAKLLLDQITGNRRLIPVALKMWLNIPENIAKRAHDIQDIVKDTYGLDYEVKVYRQIINKILTENYSPNFISYVGYGNCSMYNKNNELHISSFLSGAQVNNIKKGFDNAYIPGIWKNRDVGVSMLLLEKVEARGPTMTLHSFIRNMDEKTEQTEYPKVLFQIVYSLAVMAKFKLVHNDLHSDNILVVDHIDPVASVFKVGKHKFLIKSRYVPYIFDWDFAYSPLLGDNGKIKDDEYYCGKLNLCNSFDPRFDIYTLFCIIQFRDIVSKTYDVQTTRTKEGYVPVNNRHRQMFIDRKGYPISRKEQEALLRLPNHYLRGHYKLSRAQINEVFERKTINDYLPKVSHVLLEVYLNNRGNPEIIIQKGTLCRPTAFSDDMPTARELLDHEYFSAFKLRNRDRDEHKLQGIAEYSLNGSQRPLVKPKLQRSTFMSPKMIRKKSDYKSEIDRIMEEAREKIRRM